MDKADHLLIKAALGEPVERVPVWLMRQAGRILPQYREIRNKLSGFKELIKTPELAAKVTIQPVDELGVDAAIIFSDILVVPEAMGLSYDLVEKKGPSFPSTIETKDDVDQLRVLNAERDCPYVGQAIELTHRELNGRVPLIGFAGAPWTIFAYMIEGTGSKAFAQARKFLYQQPALSHQLLDKITASTINYLRAQVDHGASMIQLFDSWAGILPREQYRTFGLNYIQRICSEFPDVPVIVFPKGAYFARQELAHLNCQVISLDWNMDPVESRKLLGAQKTLQGNLDPALLYADPSDIQSATKRMIDAFGQQRYIANLGHGVYPDTPLDHVKAFVQAVKEYG